MKRTSSQALIASNNRVKSRIASFGRHPMVAGPGVILAFVLCFFLGRESVSTPTDFGRAIAKLKLNIMLQQGEIRQLALVNRGNINALTVRMAELQAASTRIDALGERLAKMGQLTPDEFDFNQTAAVGGPADPESLVAATEDELRFSIGLMNDKLQRQA